MVLDDALNQFNAPKPSSSNGKISEKYPTTIEKNNQQNKQEPIPTSNDQISYSSSVQNDQKFIMCGKDTGMTNNQMIAVVLLSLFFFLSQSFYSIFAPFYPGVAVKKEMSKTQIGLIFGVFQFTLLVLSPIFGKYLEAIGVRFLFVGGLFIASGSEILFGFLDRCPNGNIYFILSMACRVVCALGTSMGLSYAVVGYYFPNHISTIVALLETCSGLGMMIGPVIGGLLFEIGGFPLPFFFMGGLLAIVFIVAFFIFPDPHSTHRQRRNEATLPILPLLMIPQFNLTLMMLFCGALSITFIEPSIQLHLQPLNVSSVELGFIFFIPSLLYAIITPVVGVICDKYPKSLPMFMIVSAFISAFAFSFIGPIPYFKLPLKLPIFISAFFLFGFAFGGLLIPVYSELMQIAGEAGYPVDDLRTHGIISGVFNSVWSLGAMLGPISGGAVVELIGFDMATFLIVCLFISVGLIYAICYMCKIKRTHVLDQPNNIEQNENINSPLLVNI